MFAKWVGQANKHIYADIILY